MKYPKILFLLIFFDYYSLQSFYSPWYLRAIEKTAFSYQTKCQFINCAQYIKNNVRILKKDYKTKNIIKTHFLKKEKRILQRLGTSLGFSQDKWSECLQTINDIKNNAQKLVSDNVYHDPSIPQELLFLIKTLLTNNNINPNTVNISVCETDKPHSFATTSITLECTFVPTAVPCIQQPHLTPKITLYKQTLNEPPSYQLAIIGHETEHLCLQHSITVNVILLYVRHYLHQEQSFLEQNKDFQQLKVIYEEQAEIFAALKSAKVAQALVDFRSRKLYPGHLHEEHYYNLVEINNLWKAEKSD